MLLLIGGLCLLLSATPVTATEFLLVGDPGNPGDDIPPKTNGTSGVCADGRTICQSNNNCTTRGAPLPCTKFDWPEEYQVRGAVDYPFMMSRFPVSVAEFVAYLNGSGREAPARSIEGWQQPGGGVRFIPPLVEGTPGSYQAVLPDFPWPYANRNDALRYINWLGDGDETGGSYDCSFTNCDPARLPGAPFGLPTLHEWRKAAAWDPTTQTWWRQPGNGGAEPEPGVDANVAAAEGWGTGFGMCDDGSQYPLAECKLVPNGSYPHYVSPWGIEDLCGNGIELSESCGELLGEIECSRMLALGIHPWFRSEDCRSESFQQAGANLGQFNGTAFRLVRPVPEPARGWLGGAAGTALLLVGGRRRGSGVRSGASAAPLGH